MWYKFICPFEGASGDGQQIELYIQWSGEFDMVEIWEHLLDNKQKVDSFGEHSLDEETVQEVGSVTEEEIMECVESMGKPDYALFEDGRVYYMEYYGSGDWYASF